MDSMRDCVPLVMPGLSRSDDVATITQMQEAEVSRESRDFVGGLVQAFLHKERLDAGEMECIAKDSKLVGGDVGKIMAQIGVALQHELGKDLPLIPGAPAAGAAHRQ